MVFETHNIFLGNLDLSQIFWNKLVSFPFYIERNLGHKIILWLRHVMTEITSLDPHLIHAYSVEISLPWESVLSPLEGFKTVTTLGKKKSTLLRMNDIHTGYWYCLKIFFLSRYDKLRETERTSEGFVTPKKGMLWCERVWANSFRKSKMGGYGIGELFQFTSRLQCLCFPASKILS